MRTTRNVPSSPLELYLDLGRSGLSPLGGCRALGCSGLSPVSSVVSRMTLSKVSSEMVSSGVALALERISLEPWLGRRRDANDSLFYLSEGYRIVDGWVEVRLGHSSIETAGLEQLTHRG